MAATKQLPRAKAGDVLTADMWNQLVDHVNRSRVIFGQGNGFDVQETPFGQIVRATAGAGGSFLGKTSSSITARSGTTAGTGTVTPQDFDGTDLAATGDADETVYSFSATAIDTGLYCVYTDFGGYLFVTAVECAP